MAYLKRDQILNADDIKTQDVDVPEWGGTVCVKGMTGTERDAFEASLLNQSTKGQTLKMDNVRAKLVAWTVVDPETKERLFTTGDIEILGKKSAAALDRIFTVAQKMSKISDEDVEELIKN